MNIYEKLCLIDELENEMWNADKEGNEELSDKLWNKVYNLKWENASIIEKVSNKSGNKIEYKIAMRMLNKENREQTKKIFNK